MVYSVFFTLLVLLYVTFSLSYLLSLSKLSTRWKYLEVGSISGLFQLNRENLISERDSCCFSSIVPSETAETRFAETSFRKKPGGKFFLSVCIIGILCIICDEVECFLIIIIAVRIKNYHRYTAYL